MIQLPSGSLRFFKKVCWATIGHVSNFDHSMVLKAKAGYSRWLGKRPHVRGVAMNPCEHAHGGGEGRSPVGRLRPVSPWGKPALGKKTRKSNKYSNIYLL